ncbi:unnamed protein product [Symbiodinium sp. CCMP2456]|nr:unnamed protein product [Symbiodinium sp. CCMP2456]
MAHRITRTSVRVLPRHRCQLCLSLASVFGSSSRCCELRHAGSLGHAGRRASLPRKPPSPPRSICPKWLGHILGNSWKAAHCFRPVVLPSLVRAGACAPWGDFSRSGPAERKTIWVQKWHRHFMA